MKRAMFIVYYVKENHGNDWNTKKEWPNLYGRRIKIKINDS